MVVDMIIKTNTKYPMYNLGSYLFIKLCPFWSSKCIGRIAHFSTEDKSVKQAYTFNCSDGSSIKITLVDCIKDKTIYNKFIKGTIYEDIAFSLLFGDK